MQVSCLLAPTTHRPAPTQQGEPVQALLGHPLGGRIAEHCPAGRSLSSINSLLHVC